MGRRGYGLFAAGIAALFGSGALGASCSLETAGITGSTSSTSGVPSGTGSGGGAGGAGGAGSGGQMVSGNPESCPGAEVRLSPGSPVTISGTLAEKKHNVTPSCSAAPMANDLIYRVLPETDGTLKVTFSAPPDFKGSLSIRSSCEDSVVPIELGCADKDFFQQAWVRANAPYYVVVDSTPSDFSISFTLLPCGDGSAQECDGGDCKGCVACNQTGEFWDDPMKKRSCYKLVATKASFAEARRDCLAWGGDLAGINDFAELTFLQQRNEIAIAEDFWVGGYAREPACSYVWTDGEPGFPWSGFGMGQPGPAHELCLGLRQDGMPPHSLDDKPCATPRSYLCERASVSSCGDGVIQPGEECDDTSAICQHCLVHCEQDEFKDEISHHCYRIIQAAATWEAAKNDCAFREGYLAVITSQEENDRLMKQMNPGGAELWLGLIRSGLTSWQWDRPSEKVLCSPHWQKAQPLSGDCATIHEDGLWTSRACGSQHGYVCERGP